MSPNQVVSNEHMDTLKSPYTCIKCGEGSMIPAVQEGEPEYTENYLCVKCHFHDTIPAHGILISQAATSVIGLLLCFFLFYDYVFASTPDSANTVEHSALGLVVGAFCIGFIFVLFKAWKGHLLRQSYLTRKQPSKK